MELIEKAETKNKINYYFIQDNQILFTKPLDWLTSDVSPAEDALKLRDEQYPNAIVAVTVSEYFKGEDKND